MSSMTRLACVIGTVVVAAAAARTVATGAEKALMVTHGVASGDVTASSAVVWARASARAQMHVEVVDDPGFVGGEIHAERSGHRSHRTSPRRSC